jgi:hypothetical protein
MNGLIQGIPGKIIYFCNSKKSSSSVNSKLWRTPGTSMGAGHFKKYYVKVP